MEKMNSKEGVLLEIGNYGELHPKEIKWLWEPFIPAGKVILLQGDPGEGKSYFMLAIAAILTIGKPLPLSNDRHEPMNVIYQTMEDDLEDTVLPRFIKCGGDRNRIFYINEKKAPLTFTDIRIKEAIVQTEAKLLVLDTLSSYIGNCQVNAANEVRPRFNSLIETARETDCAIVIIHHLNKTMNTKAVYRTPGSIDLVGAVRGSLLIGRSKENDNEHILVQQKSNFAKLGTAISFTIDEDGVHFISRLQKTADELLVSYIPPVISGRPNVKLEQAMEIISEILSDGNEHEATECEKILRQESISMTTAKKAKSILGVVSVKRKSGWKWILPEEENGVSNRA